MTDELNEQATRQGHLAVSAIMCAFNTGQIKTAETEELEALRTWIETELRERDTVRYRTEHEPF